MGACFSQLVMELLLSFYNICFIFLQTAYIEWEQAPDIYQKWLHKCHEAYKDNIEKREQTRFPREYVENADLYKPVLNKIMTTVNNE